MEENKDTKKPAKKTAAKKDTTKKDTTIIPPQDTAKVDTVKNDSTQKDNTGILNAKQFENISLQVSNLGISYQISGNAILAVFDLHGNAVLKKNISGAGIVFEEWQKLPAGRYVATLKLNGKMISHIALKR